MAESNQKSQFSQIEEEILKLWDKERTFEKSLENREGKPRFSFYDGPPFASGEPHYGHLEQTAVKDSIVRYKTMRGHYVPRRTGYDTHGLPIEYLVEKSLNLRSKQDIVKYGVGKFNKACRDIVFQHREDFEFMYKRMGRWANPAEAYATLDDNYIESVWWVFSELFKKGLIYKDYKSVGYCPRCATPLSNFEVNDGYKDDVEDPSLYVKFQLEKDPRSLLAWTTTPWSLPGNAALAVHPDAKYVTVEIKNDDGKSEQLILAETRLDVLSQKYKVITKTTGAELEGLRYQPLFTLPSERTEGRAYKLISSQNVNIEEGTGVLHVAPSFGEEDLELGRRFDLPVLHSVDQNGLMREDIGIKGIAGLFFKDADRHIIEHLSKGGAVYSAQTIKHTYPFCWRCETPLLYYAIDGWFVKVTDLKTQLLKNAKNTQWTPAHFKAGRFLKWLEGARDWSISRNRFWGAPIPLWQCEDGHLTVVSSIKELKHISTNMPASLDLHKPGIDEVQIDCGECGKRAERVPEVLDCWFESGSMPYAQDHYPFSNKDKFEEAFPADFVVEAYEQINLWFYTLHVLAGALFDKPAYKNVIADGLILAADGKKLSKRLRNYPPIEILLDKFGADTTRFFILSSPLMVGRDTRLDEDAFKDIYRSIFMTLWNVLGFFKTYTEVDKWQPPKQLSEPKTSNVLDRWILSRLNQTTTEVTKRADSYQISKATRPLMGLIDDLSNWYVRRSRRRFWKSENDDDKEQAYQTLHYVLVRVCQLLAPWAPFMSDHIYRELKNGQMPQSVHLTDWPEPLETTVIKSSRTTVTWGLDDNLLHDMQTVREIVADGLKQRAEAGVKVRQPLASATLPTTEPRKNDNLASNIELQKIIAEELNVREIKFKSPMKERVKIDTAITPDLKAEGLAREIIRQIQQYRKDLDLDVSDRIELHLSTNDKVLTEAIDKHQTTLKAETLTTFLDSAAKGPGKTVKIEGGELKIAISKAK